MTGTSRAGATPVARRRRSRRRWTAQALLVVALVVSLAGAAAIGPAFAEEAPDGPSPEAGAARPPPLFLAPRGADEAGRRQAAAEVKTSEDALRAAEAARRRAGEAAARLREEVTGAEAVIAALTAAEQRLAESLAATRLKVKKMAVAGYLSGGDTQPLDYLLRATDPMDLARRRQLVSSANEARQVTLRDYQVAQAATGRQLAEAVVELERATSAADRADGEEAAAAAWVVVVEAEVGRRRLLLDLVTAAAPAGATDIPRLVLDAYQRAAAAVSKRAPNCRIHWTAVAAIGKIESDHGRYRGSQLALNGDVYPRILGIRLDGTRSALIRDTDGGVMDDDTEFDHAVGPMQFIPSTWARVDEDGNGDGVRDPNNIYDAAQGTAAYLCRAVPSGGLDKESGLRPAFFAYNHSDAYVEDVLGWVNRYRALALAPL